MQIDQLQYVLGLTADWITKVEITLSHAEQSQMIDTLLEWRNSADPHVQKVLDSLVDAIIAIKES